MAGPSVGLKHQMLPHMLAFVVRTYFPHISPPSEEEKELTPIEIRAFFEEVVQSTAKMVALWQCVGYVHGVMNTDNMSILGLTIDYGPFGFMEYYNPRLVSNHSDDQARYCYENQPSVCKWNLKRLAEALDPLLPLEESSQYIDTNYDELYSSEYLSQMGKKLGFFSDDIPSIDTLTETQFKVIESLFKVMEQTSVDFTNAFRAF